MIKAVAHEQSFDGEDQSAILLLSQLCNFRLPGVSNNQCGLTGMLNSNEDAALVDNSSKMLQKQSVMQTQNARFIPAFLLSNARTTFSS